jgi:hypothetical protein
MAPSVGSSALFNQAKFGDTGEIESLWNEIQLLTFSPEPGVVLPTRRWTSGASSAGHFDIYSSSDERVK